MDRRRFVRAAAACGAALWVPAWSAELEAAVGVRPAAAARRPRPARPVRVRGRVRAAGKGVRRVAVTDGLAVAETDADGYFELVTDEDREFVYVSVPSGYRIPTNPTGTARFHRRLRAGLGGEMDAAFELEPLDRPDHTHTVFVLADPQTQDEEEVRWLHEQTVPDVRAEVESRGEHEVVGIACGDIMFDRLELFPAYERAVAGMGIPFFQVVGNHDLDGEARTDELSHRTFARHFGPGHYSFDRGAAHYVILDDVFWYGSGYLGYVTEDQLRWLEADLRRVEAGRPVFVAVHIPFSSTQAHRRGEQRPSPQISVTNREAVFRLLEPYSVHVLSGHMHESEHVFEGKISEHVSGAVCGAWWSGPICADGTPAGHAVFEIRGEEVRWRYKATGFPRDHQIRTYAHGADPRAPDEIVANVWSWDPGWTVVWSEDGERRGAMARRVGPDPLSVRLHTGPDLPPRRPWVEPYPTGHLFYAPAARAAREIRVEAWDRFGNMFSAVVPRE